MRNGVMDIRNRASIAVCRFCINWGTSNMQFHWHVLGSLQCQSYCELMRLHLKSVVSKKQ